jgi:hypothetical protein
VIEELVSKYSEREKVFIRELVKDCINWNLKENEALEYIRTRFQREISIATYNRYKSAIMGDKTVTAWYNTFIRVGFLIEHKLAIDRIKANIEMLMRLLAEENFNAQYKLFYHAEYFPSLVTGIFDNLALLTASLYSIRMDTIRISLSNSSGNEFLGKIEGENLPLKKLLDGNVDLRNLIYEFRERVVHREGLQRIELPIAPNWTNFFKIDSEIYNHIVGCGDTKTKYKYITQFGIVKNPSGIFIDPYYFCSEYFDRLTNFVEDYIALIT